MAKTKEKTLAQRALPFLKAISESKDLTVVVFIISILAIIIVPLPSALLDFFLTISIAVSVLIILISLYIAKPTDFTAFPTLLLIVTLFRLALNVSTTRMILSEGHNGPDAVSDIISSFGNFVVGGNYVIGIIVFLILVIINFMVVTNGSTRVAEVAARFTLDAMPGKQMAIDADMNAGLIDEKEAKKRREGLAQEADFYGSMDGASKFVKGDAIAGIIITLINIIGGFLIGVFQHDLTMASSATTFTILTIGDGLVSQLPALIISTATGIIVTRSSKNDEGGNFAEGIITQLMSESKILTIVGGILLMFALVPGLPTLSLGFVGLLFVGMAYLIKRQEEGGAFDLLERFINKKAGEPLAAPLLSKKPKTAKEGTALGETGEGQIPATPPKKSPEEIKKQEEEALSEILKVEILELDLGYQLIKLADSNQGGDLLERVRGMRRKMAADYGFLMPQVRIRDNLQLPPSHYEILLKGVAIGEGSVLPDRFLAMNSGLVTDEIEGTPTKEPAFGLDAIWIDPREKEEAIMRGYTVVDPATVISTHMSELVKKYAEELITRQEVHALMDKLAKDYPIIVEDARKSANTGLIQQVLKALLHERIPIKDMLTILETIADVAPQVGGNLDVIVEQVRARLSRVITNVFKNEDGILKLLTLSTQTEQHLLNKVKDQQGRRQFLLSVNETNALIEGVSGEVQRVLQRGVVPVVIIVDPLLRKFLADKMEQFGLDVVVLSHAEIDTSAKFEVLGTITIPF
ncbi:flagellar biosynthesis protein FlhA [Wolinella succinogenes]|uniref:flagellar biosynthesis protein FlhA n=1 Tax=Wolinella succinogenes TaxID=844 RepID=UPI002409D599|nr:flagellar biosynthesis protein FlhA [Wolinella succinogenes]